MVSANGDDREPQMSEEQMNIPIEEAEERGLAPTCGHPHPLALGGATFLTAGVVDLLGPLGTTGLVIGGIAAIVAARHSGDIYDQVRELFPSLPPQRTEHRSPSRHG